MVGAPEQRIRCVGAVVLDDAGQLLLVRRAREPGRGRWSVPGGRLETGESDHQAVIREVAEETGLVVEAVARRGFTDDPMPEVGRHYVTLFVECTVIGGQARIGEPDKATDLAWYTPAELRERELFAPLRRWLDLT